VYDDTFELIQKDWKEGLKIAVVSEGDASTYSSFSYLLERFDQAEIAVNLIPGITSYNLGAAVSRTVLGLQNEKMTILPRVQTN
ncbi:MAG: SAM-dependent methyltransferase, partial [Crocinitomicaceae bacterium]|nr:SAM-dependent methyltransferase [Crocinitomicaceae bacterium]